MDQMNLATGKAGHGLIRMITIPNGIIGKPGLHVLARIGAPKDHRHNE
jgi:hypothetical protein